MTTSCAHVRSRASLAEAAAEARRQWHRLREGGARRGGPGGPAGGEDEALREAFTTRQLCLAHLVYLEAALFAVESGVGSRGSALVLAPEGEPVDGRLGEEWRHLPEDPSFREYVMETVFDGEEARCAWVPRRPIPETDTWFETAWAAYREGRIYG
jgi:hypothetical protein